MLYFDAKGQVDYRCWRQAHFQGPLTHWGGIWYTVVYSLPEEKRQLRNELRKKLIWSGFGRLAPGTWISPHDRRAEIEPIIDVGVRHYTSLFASRNLELMSNAVLVARCWDLGDLQADYAAFVERWQPELAESATFMGMYTLPRPAIAVPQLNQKLENDSITDEMTTKFVTEWLEAFRDWIIQLNK